MMQLYHGVHSNPSLPSQFYNCDGGLKQQTPDLHLTHPEGKHSWTSQLQQQQDTTTGVSASINFLSTFLEDTNMELATVEGAVLDSSPHSVEVELMHELLQALQDEAPAHAITAARPAAVPAAAACPHTGLMQQHRQQMIGAAMRDAHSGMGGVSSRSDFNECPNWPPAAAMPAPAAVSPSPFAQYSTQDATFSQQQLQQIINEEMQRMVQAPASAAPASAAPAAAAVAGLGPFQGQQQQQQLLQQQQYQLSLQVSPQAGPSVENTSSPCTLLSPATDTAHTGSWPSHDDSAVSLTVMSSVASSAPACGSSGLLPLQQVRTAKVKSPVGVSTPCDSQQPAGSLAHTAAAAAAASVQPSASVMDFTMQHSAGLVEPWRQQQHGVLGSILPCPAGTSAPAAAATAAAAAAAGGGCPFAAAMDSTQQLNPSAATTAFAMAQQQHGGLEPIMTQQGGCCAPRAALIKDGPTVSHAMPDVTWQHLAGFPGGSSSCDSILQTCIITPRNEAVPPNVANKQLQLQQLKRCLVELQKLQQLREQDGEDPCEASAGIATHSTQQNQLHQMKRASSVPCEIAAMQQQQQLLQQSGGVWSSSVLAGTEQHEQWLLQYSQQQQQQQQQQLARVSSMPCSLAAMQQQQLLCMPPDQQLLVQAEQQTHGQQLHGRSDEARRKSLGQRKSSIEQRRSFEHKLFKARRPLQPAVTPPPTAAVNLAISDRVKAKIQRQHQQRQLQQQVERKLRQQTHSSCSSQ